MKRRLNFIIHSGYAKWDTYPETRVWCKWDTYHETEGVLTCSCYPAKHSFRYTKTFYILLCYDPLPFTTFLSCAFTSASYPCFYSIVPMLRSMLFLVSLPLCTYKNTPLFLTVCTYKITTLTLCPSTVTWPDQRTVKSVVKDRVCVWFSFIFTYFTEL